MLVTHEPLLCNERGDCSAFDHAHAQNVAEYSCAGHAHGIGDYDAIAWLQLHCACIGFDQLSGVAMFSHRDKRSVNAGPTARLPEKPNGIEPAIQNDECLSSATSL